MHNTTELLTAARPNLHSQIMNLPCLVPTSQPEIRFAYKEGHRDARHAAASLVAAQPPRTGMSRDEAFELLEVHFGPQASLSIHEEANRYFSPVLDKRDEQVVKWVVYANVDCTPRSWTRDTLSEAVAAAVSSVEAHKEQA